MGFKARAKSNAWVPDPRDEDGLIAIPKMDLSETGKHKTAGILTPLMGEAIEVRIHRQLTDHDITAMNIMSVEFKRLGRGKAAMEPGAMKQMLIKVRYRDGE